MSSDSDDDMPLARANGRGKLPPYLHLLIAAMAVIVLSTLNHTRRITQMYFENLFQSRFMKIITNWSISVSDARIPKDVDKAMDKAAAKTHAAPAGVSIRNGPVVEDKMAIDGPATNGNAKRKARNSVSRAVNYNVDGTDGDSD